NTACQRGFVLIWTLRPLVKEVTTGRLRVTGLGSLPAVQLDGAALQPCQQLTGRIRFSLARYELARAMLVSLVANRKSYNHAFCSSGVRWFSTFIRLPTISSRIRRTRAEPFGVMQTITLRRSPLAAW